MTITISAGEQWPDPSHGMSIDADNLQAVSEQHQRRPPERQVLLRSKAAYYRFLDVMLPLSW